MVSAETKEVSQNLTNPCLGCAACCRNISLELFQDEFARLVTEANPVFCTEQQVNEIIAEKHMPGGIYYYISEDGIYNVEIKGFCPQLLGGECRIYTKKPHACSNFLVGSPECQKVQKTTGLKPLNESVSSPVNPQPFRSPFFFALRAVFHLS